jgi:molybdopterin-synthase adenylyltransferase
MLGERERQRYARQMTLFGEEGQERLKAAKIFIAGVGGLGCPIALYLAAAGVGEIRLVDGDVVDRSNLNRQILHWEEDIGRRKTASAAEKLGSVNPDVVIQTVSATIDETNAAGLVGDANLIVDALDNYPARYLLNRVALRKGIPFIHGAVRGFDGQAATIIPNKSACLRCIFPEAPPLEPSPVIGITPGIIGMIQANEAIKYLLGMDGLLVDRLLIWNGAASEAETLPVGRQVDCEDCGVGVEMG